MDDFPNRRRFLELTGVGTAVSVAGCGQFDTASQDDGDENTTDGEDENSTDDGDDGEDTDEGNGSDGNLGPTATITAYVQPSEEEMTELQQRQAELSQQAQAGEINQSEYESELQQLQEDQIELIEAAVEEFESTAEESENLEIADSATEMGLLLLEGSAGALIETLNAEDVDGLLPEATFEEAQMQGP